MFCLDGWRVWENGDGNEWDDEGDDDGVIGGFGIGLCWLFLVIFRLFCGLCFCLR